jgi:hypothetical protein
MMPIILLYMFLNYYRRLLFELLLIIHPIQIFFIKNIIYFIMIRFTTKGN